MRTRTYRQQVWLNDEEKNLLVKKSKSAGLDASNYIRKIILGYQLHEKPDTEFYNAIKLLRATTNNLNQIAKKAHSLNFIDAPYYNEEVKKLNDFIDDIRVKYLISKKKDDD